ncbi:MAG TPA: hypothetical protein DDW88_02580 [Treponema sp.]|nr:hypothetical protein [Treponema sp.]
MILWYYIDRRDKEVTKVLDWSSLNHSSLRFRLLLMYCRKLRRPSWKNHQKSIAPKGAKHRNLFTLLRETFYEMFRFLTSKKAGKRPAFFCLNVQLLLVFICIITYSMVYYMKFFKGV